MDSIKAVAKFTGAGYLVIFITGFFSNFFVLEGLTVPGDAAATLQNFSENNMMFRFGIFSFIMMVVFDVLLAWSLYLLLKPVNSKLSLLSASLRLVNGTIFGVALYNLFGILHLTAGDGYMQAFDASGLQFQIMLYLDAFNDTWLIGLIFFGIHLYFLGYLIMKSGYIPKFIGILLIIAAFGYLIDSLANFLLPEYESFADVFMLIVVIPGVLGELSFTVWLLARGGKLEEREI